MMIFEAAKLRVIYGLDVADLLGSPKKAELLKKNLWRYARTGKTGDLYGYLVRAVWLSFKAWVKFHDRLICIV